MLTTPRWIRAVPAIAVSLTTFLCLGTPAAATLEKVADLNPGSVGSFPSNITVYAENVLFGAYTQATGTELWRYDGTNVVLVRDINDTADDLGFGVMEGNDSFPAWLTPFDGQVLFSAFDPYRGGELWQMDGLTATRAADINPDADDSVKLWPNSSWPQELTVFEGALYFSANGDNVSTNYELWRYEGGVASLAADIHPARGTNHSSHPNHLKVVEGALYFMADDGANGYELWRHAGQETVLFNINPGDSSSSSYPKHFTAYAGKVYFQAFHPDYGFELWQTDGTTVTLAADLNPGPDSSNPEFFTIYDNALYFRASGASEGNELWKFDGAVASLVHEINPFGDAFPKNLTLFNGSLYFAANDGGSGWELWAYDGSTPALVMDLNPAGDSFPESLIVQNSALYFVATTPETGYEIFRFDGQSITLAGDVNPGAGDSFPQFLTSYKDKLLFRATHDGFNDWELWSLTTSSASANEPPSVSLTEPADGSIYLVTDTISFFAEATDDEAVAQVEFFANDQLLGVDSSAPYEFTSSLPAGTYSITAKATDNLGASASSSAIEIIVRVEPGEPMIDSVSLESAAVVISATGTSGVEHVLEASHDLNTWVPIATNTPSGGMLIFRDEELRDLRFYRVLVP